MAKDRLADAFTYLKKPNTLAGMGLTLQDIDRFEWRVDAVDLTQNGAVLSLDWNRYDNQRPGADTRQAIRAYLLALIYDGQLAPAFARTEALRVKQKTLTDLRTDTGRIIDSIVNTPPLTTAAVLYTRNVPGADKTRTLADTQVCKRTVPDEMRARYAEGERLGVLLIDMQSNGDSLGANVGHERSFDCRTTLQHMQDVLDMACELGLTVYDVVIDKEAAALRATTPGRVNTVSALRTHMPSKPLHRFMPKGYFNCFQDSPLAGWLQDDRVETLVVLGFHANLCVANTIFGTPSDIEPDGPSRPRTESEVAEYMKANPLKPGEALNVNKAYTYTPMRNRPYIDGLLDRGYGVLTSRCILASGGATLEADYRTLEGL